MVEPLSLYSRSTDLETRVDILQRDYQLETPDPKQIDELLGLLEGKKIIDVGCGIGTTLLPFGPQLYLTPGMIGMDTSLAVLKRAQEKQRIAGNPPLILVHASIENIPFPDNTYDLVLARHMLYHVNDIPRGVKEMHRVLKKNGCMMATTNSAHSRPELNAIHQEALKQFPQAKLIPRVSIRFGSENGENVLKKSFRRVQTIPWSGRITFNDVTTPLDYYTSTQYFQYALENEQEKERLKQLVAQKIKSVIEKQGSFTITSWGSIYLAYKAE